ncbi:MAG: metallophosphoesterase [Candidatus Lokiarchaeota archaeon]|nr:metallophosphoesterase [Candidatus Lokiarchaeota archaeon]
MSFFNVLHFSDLHFGRGSQIKNMTNIDLFFKNFKDWINKFQNFDEKKTSLVIMSGDFGSYGESTNDIYLKKFLKIFNDINIPIIPCNGNHDIRLYNDRKERLEVHPFVSLINNYKDFFNCQYIGNINNDFKKYLACYYVLEDINSIFISINSSEDTEYISLGNNVWFLDDKKFIGKNIDTILQEIENHSGLKLIDLNKFVICHHPINYINNLKLVNTLKNHNIEVVFSGHIHQYNFTITKQIKNFIAGSFLVNAKSRKDIYNEDRRFQFNRYFFDFNTNSIKSFVNYHLQEDKWIEDIQDEKVEVKLNHPNDIWNPIIRRNNINIVVGNQKLKKEDREAVGEWDILSMGKIISYLSNRSRFLQISLLPPFSTTNKYKNINILKNLKKKNENSDLIIFGSPDANTGTAIVYKSLFKDNTQKISRKILKDLEEKDISHDKKLYLDNDILEKIHKNCPFNKICNKQNYHKSSFELNITECPKCKNKVERTWYTCPICNQILGRLQYKLNTGIYFEEGPIKYTIGLCNIPYKTDENKYNYFGMGHLIISDNPFCKESECDCLKSDNFRHKLILIEGLSGPSTIAITNFLCKWNENNKFSDIIARIKHAIKKPGEYAEFLFLNNVISYFKESHENQDDRKSGEIINVYEIKRNKKLVQEENLLFIGCNKQLINPDFIKTIKNDKIESVFNNFVEGRFEKIKDILFI